MKKAKLHLVIAKTSTLTHYYDQSRSVGHVQYDDEWPGNHKHGTGGHTKGVLGFDEQGGFWLIHSVPRFPANISDGTYPGLPEDETRYGQTFMCISTSLADLDKVSKNLIIAHPWVYGADVPVSLAFGDLSYLKLLAAGQRGIDGVDSNKDEITSVGPNTPLTFTLFYKSPDWGKFLYEDLVEPYFHNSFMWETWMNGVNPDPSFCTGDGSPYQYNSTNIRHLTLGSESWKETQDHSKWGVSVGDWYDNAQVQVICIGDINRQQSQNGRGGGTTCFHHTNIWITMWRAIDQVDQCT
jgi:deoxyribonuclease-2